VPAYIESAKGDRTAKLYALDSKNGRAQCQARPFFDRSWCGVTADHADNERDAKLFQKMLGLGGHR
jgi:hypothetical protein